MSQECERLEKCGFFKKWSVKKDLACRGFIQTYCRGEKRDQCKRKTYFNEHGAPPSDDMLPSGQMIAGDTAE
ncbi:MAG: hypothetical protein GF331_16855 [Chitinivibrionales bacterium]|nr:hypothetical protein [Chitinivibrionales bacterium]